MCPISTSVRLRLLSAVVVSYLITLSPLLLFGWEGWWLANLLLVGPSPLLAISAMFAFAYPATVLRHPFVWALVAAITALTIATVLMWVLAGTLLGLLALPVAVIAPVAFWLIIKLADIQLPSEASLVSRRGRQP